MDKEDFQEQITQRYLYGKVIEGASLDEIADGLSDPLEQMDYVAGNVSKTYASSTPAAASSGNSVGGLLLFVMLILFAILSGAVRLFH